MTSLLRQTLVQLINHLCKHLKEQVLLQTPCTLVSIADSQQICIQELIRVQQVGPLPRHAGVRAVADVRLQGSLRHLHQRCVCRQLWKTQRQKCIYTELQPDVTEPCAHPDCTV